MSISDIRDAFFQECEDLLEALYEGLRQMDAEDHEMETVHAVFRAVHSIKGGAGAFGLDDLVTFAHRFETALDRVRSGDLAADGTRTHHQNPLALDPFRIPVLPPALLLVAQGTWKILGKAQHQAEHELGDGAVEYAPGVGHRYIAVPDRRDHQRIHAGAGGMDPADAMLPGPYVLQQIGAEIGHQQDVGFRQVP